MYSTHSMKILGDSLVELIGLLNSPRQDQVLLSEAKVEIDRALFPILIATGVKGPLSVSGLADLLGRDYTTISRQVSKLTALGFLARAANTADGRQTVTILTARGASIVSAIIEARERLLGFALSDWTDEDRNLLASLIRRFVDTVVAVTSNVDKKAQ